MVVMTESALPIGLQLYTLREMDAEEADVLAAVKQAGYAYVETMHRTDLSGSDWKNLLDGHGLTAVSSHVPQEAFEQDLDRTLRIYADLGVENVIVPAPGGNFWSRDKELSGSEWEELAARLRVIGQGCRDAGLSLLYHNHWQEMVDFDGTLAIDILLAETDPELLGFEPDCAWITKGGQDPVELLQRYAGRVPCVHMKDLAPEGENEDKMGLADVGSGVLDWDAIFPQIQASGAEWYIVEHDMPGDHVSSISSSYNFIAGPFVWLRRGWARFS